MRILVPIVALLAALLVAIAVFFNTAAKTPAPTSPPVEAPATDAADPVEQPSPAVGATATPAVEAEPPPAAATFADLPPLRPLPAAAPEVATLGSTEPGTPYALRVDLVPYGAGVRAIALADYRQAPGPDADPYAIHTPLEAGRYTVYPFAARSVSVNGQDVPLQTVPWEKALEETTPEGSAVEYRLTLASPDGSPVADLVRRYSLAPESYDLRLEQRVINRGSVPLRVVWNQNAQGDLTLDDAAYMGDRRTYVTGYFNPRDPNRSTIWTQSAFVMRNELLDDGVVWPSPNLREGSLLAWLASENRYFAVVTHMPVPPEADRAADVPPLEELYSRVGVSVFPNDPDLPDEARALVFTLGSEPVTVAPGAAAEFPLAVFAGPRQSAVFGAAPYTALGFDQLIRYELSCTWCTFQWLAQLLLSFLTLIETVVRDWGVAIVILVLVVRLCLHPITKRAQVNMMKMGKQMQALQPEIEKLKKKYGEDQAKMQAEMMRLYREKGVNPANMLGCLPMFLQTPIWIALYAMLYFAIELRHQPAFYGVFQWLGSLFGADWPFLADLSSADHFIPVFDEPQKISLLFIHLNFQAINILPLLMAIVMYFNMKFTTPPPANEQQAQQQKIMKFMVILFPVFLYSAPSGLTLYILASTTAGIIDSYIVRKHVREQEAAGKLFEQKPRNPNSLMGRLQRLAEEKQRELLERQQQGQRGPAGQGRGGRGGRR